jgi:hypothetical protein
MPGKTRVDKLMGKPLLRADSTLPVSTIDTAGEKSRSKRATSAAAGTFPKATARRQVVMDVNADGTGAPPVPAVPRPSTIAAVEVTRAELSGGVWSGPSAFPPIFHAYWGWMFRSLGALLTWQRRFFVFTSDGKLKCSNSERGPWSVVATADRILRVEVDSYYDASNGTAPPTSQTHQYGFFIDVVDVIDDGEHAPPPASASRQYGPNTRQRRLRFCCYSRFELNAWLHILRRATELAAHLDERRPDASPLRRKFSELAGDAQRLGGQAKEITIATAKRRSASMDPRATTIDPRVAGIDAGDEAFVVPYRARVQLEDEVALLNARAVYAPMQRARSNSGHSIHGDTPFSGRPPSVF